MEPFECSMALDAELPPCDERIAQLHRYWRAIRPEGSLFPGRQHFDPAAVPHLLPTIRLYDVHRDPWRFRYRLMGTELVRLIGRDPTGTWYHDHRPTQQPTQSDRDLVFVAEGRGICYRRGFPLQIATGKEHLSSERILLPLARDGRVVDMVLGFTVHHPAPTPAYHKRAAAV
ncbi:MAG TPA: PAS domain-containing protein [Stellaceae bacterium]|nr:PAS domain-containing protein [Stellaceae bacterium]